jgi:hypothetical protein
MIDRTEAEEHLRVIRSLMEKSTVYRALSAPSALVGGLLSVAAAGGIVGWERRNGPNDVDSTTFALVWGVVFAATAIVSLALIRRDAARRGEPFVSVGFRSAMRAMLPAMSFAALFTLAHFARKTVHYCVPWWIALYGLALLGMGHFAPRSIAILGWFFLVTGALTVGGLLDMALAARLPFFIDAPCLLMAATFGLFHLVYAACTWPRRGRDPLER